MDEDDIEIEQVGAFAVTLDRIGPMFVIVSIEGISVQLLADTHDEGLRAAKILIATGAARVLEVAL